MSGNYCLRALDPAERFIWLLDRISCANFVVIAELAGRPISEETLRAALDDIQAAHPLLSARVVEEPTGAISFFREQGSRLPLHVETVTQADWQSAIEPEFNAGFDDLAQPMARCRLLQLPGRQVLTLTFHHAIGDARSGAAILGQLLRACLRGTGIVIESETPPPLHALFAGDWLRHPAGAQDLGRLMREEFLRHGPPAELPFLDHEEPSRVPRLRTIRWSAQQGRRLQQRCRDEGTSVHGAVCAAHLIATRELFGDADPRTLYLMCPVDLRPHLTAEMGERLSYCTTFLRSAYRVKDDAGFWPLAREISADMKRRMQRGDGHLGYAGLPLDKIGGSGPAFDAFAGEVARLPGGSNISNIGRVPVLDDCPEVTGISFALCSLPKHLASLNVSSYRDELTVNMTCDAAKLSPDLADRLAGGLRRLLDRAAAMQEAGAAA